MKIYVIGYSGYGYLVEWLMHSNEKRLLIDTRKIAWSDDMPQWREESLRLAYGKRYRPAGSFLGNVNYARSGAPIQIANLSVGIAGLRKYLEEGYELLLLCGCRYYTRCHLQVIVSELVRAMPTVEVVIAGSHAIEGMMACLSGWQPYPYFVTHPEIFIQAGLPPKRVENRDWTTDYTGPLLLHAGKTFEAKAIAYWSRQLGLDLRRLLPADYDRGCIVGVANLVQVAQDCDDIWFMGEYGFQLSDVRRLDPIPYRGRPGLFYVPLSIVPLDEVMC